MYSVLFYYRYYFLLQVVRSYILEFVSPVAVPHGCNLLGSVAVAWNDRRRKVPGYNKKVSFSKK